MNAPNEASATLNAGIRAQAQVKPQQQQEGSVTGLNVAGVAATRCAKHGACATSATGDKENIDPVLCGSASTRPSAKKDRKPLGSIYARPLQQSLSGPRRALGDHSQQSAKVVAQPLAGFAMRMR